MTPPDLVTPLARKWCRNWQLEHGFFAGDKHQGAACICQELAAAVREALEGAENLGREHDVMHPCKHGCEVGAAIAALRGRAGFSCSSG